MARNICAKALHANVDITGQNGKTANQDPVLETACAKKQKRHPQQEPRRGL